MKLAFITPVQHFHFALMSNIHLVLTPVMDEPDIGRAYTEQYRMLDHSAHYKILDNGAHENDGPTKIEETLGRARAIRAHEVVMPDVQQEPNATVDAVREAVDWLLTDYGMDSYQFSMCPNLMYVPQGTNRQEWVGCLKFLIEEHERLVMAKTIFPHQPVIGIAKKHALIDGMSITECCQWVRRLTERAGESTPVHLLGWPDRTSILQIREDFPFVRSIDTAKPITLGYYGTDAIKDEVWSEKPRPDSYFMMRFSEQQKQLAQKNCEKFLQVVEGKS